MGEWCWEGAALETHGPYRLETVSHNRAVNVIQPSFIYPWSGCVRPECKKGLGSDHWPLSQVVT